MARIACAVNGYLGHVGEDPEWGRILLYAAANLPKRDIPSRPDLIEDLERAQKAGQLRFQNLELAADIVLAMVVEATAAICSGLYPSVVIREAVPAVLRALGLNPDEADSVLALIEKMPYASSNARQTGDVGAPE